MIITKTENKEQKAKGWPVVATGCKEYANQFSFAAWCRNNEFPDESPDFSPHDVFDVLEFLIAKEISFDSFSDKKPALSISRTIKHKAYSA